jgi:hypothetical protein
LEGIEALDENLREQQEALVAGVVFMEAPNHPRCHEFAKNGARAVDALCREPRLRLEEEDAVGEEAVY